MWRFVIRGSFDDSAARDINNEEDAVIRDSELRRGAIERRHARRDGNTKQDDAVVADAALEVEDLPASVAPRNGEGLVIQVSALPGERAEPLCVKD